VAAARCQISKVFISLYISPRGTSPDEEWTPADTRAAHTRVHMCTRAHAAEREDEE